VAPFVGHDDAASIAAALLQGSHYCFGLAPSGKVIRQDLASLVRDQLAFRATFKMEKIPRHAGALRNSQPPTPKVAAGHPKNIRRPEPPSDLNPVAGHASNLAACPIGRQPPDCRWERGSCELRIMAPVSEYRDDHLVLNDFGQLGRAFLETDVAEADHEAVIRNFLSGQYQNALRVIAFNTAEGWSRDVSEDIAGEVLDRAYDADETLTDGTKRFIDRHITSGEKRPPAPSVRRGIDAVARKTRA
jgi:hypothetical protein